MGFGGFGCSVQGGVCFTTATEGYSAFMNPGSKHSRNSVLNPVPAMRCCAAEGSLNLISAFSARGCRRSDEFFSPPLRATAVEETCTPQTSAAAFLCKGVPSLSRRCCRQTLPTSSLPLSLLSEGEIR
ncbi:hypothetical protein TraAM80_08192 [Trypanosoma rangeli]|uniref:Uncharacterized protein n=1 Tax=Trypanosoma rangeli TaxID=5698 RepID=A0A3R7M4T7_TRYRA|nr:uncharacterized protein TraAM80_08192 [Trypanosoma rangeli]RNE99441.1 hypothetical protein TraAM80_08192 [Trypanosoma rangeli]|eukprot:RNE99441.1 hypothetical protein TraAM80_08192 [Trypanosoma rangeli]